MGRSTINWDKHRQEFSQSGLTMKAYCEQAGLKYNSRTRSMLSRSSTVKTNVKPEKVSLKKRKNVTLESDKKTKSVTPESDKTTKDEKSAKTRAAREEGTKPLRTGQEQECHSTQFEKQSSWGGNRLGAGAPLNNSNAMTHGLYCSELSEEEQALYNTFLGETQQLEHELALSRVLLKRAVARDADMVELDKLLAEESGSNEGDSALNNAPLTLEAWEMFDGEEGNPLNGQKWVKKRPDTGAIVERRLGRVASLEASIFKMHGGLRLKRYEQLALQAHVIDQLGCGEITPMEAGRALEREGMPIPPVLAMEIKATLSREEIDDQAGITEEELDAICEEALQHQQEESKWLQERRQWITEWEADK